MTLQILHFNFELQVIYQKYFNYFKNNLLKANGLRLQRV